MEGGTVIIVILGLLIFSVLCFKRALTLKKRQGEWVKPKEDTGYIGADTSPYIKSTIKKEEKQPKTKSRMTTSDSSKKDKGEVWSGVKEIPFDYLNTKGISSSRTLILHKLLISEKGVLTFQVHCLQRNTTRTFSVGSITSNIRYDGKFINPFVFIEEELDIIIDAKNIVDSSPSLSESPKPSIEIPYIYEPESIEFTSKDVEAEIRKEMLKKRYTFNKIESEDKTVMCDEQGLRMYKSFKNGKLKNAFV
ncbi:hypothetical protein [Marinomonas shanghaiensis]|uniref:hypothetical protein n=1 Tax=Marinomonas shanghaiensis TaxID=2202418 RepID=UPI000DB9E928|nr:hypothetical protein [Marinomonas shanghaiensis]